MLQTKKNISTPIDKYPGLKGYTKWIFAILHAALMMLLLYWYQIIPFSYTLDAPVIAAQSYVKNGTLLRELYHSNYRSENFIFIDVSNDKAIGYDENELRKTILTDRRQLSEVFAAIRKVGGYRFLLCDLIFPVATSDDNTFRKEIDLLPRAGFPIHPDSITYSPESVLRELPGAKADYSYYSSPWWKMADHVVKFKLFNDTQQPSIPVFLLQKIDAKHISKTGFALKNVTVDATLRPQYLLSEPYRIPVYDIDGFLVQLSGIDTIASRRFLSDKVIVVADFDNDSHQTAFGKMPGALLLINVYISLSNANHIVGLFAVLILLGCFSAISYHVLYPGKFWLSKCYDLINRVFKFLFFNKPMSEFVAHSVILIIVSTITYLISGILLGMTILAFWLIAFSWILDKSRGWPTFSKEHPKRRSLFNFLIQKQSP